MINKKDFKIICPFKGWVLESFPYIEADFDAITNYQLFSKVVEYLNKIRDNMILLENSDNELIDAFNNLKAYIDEYLYSIPDFEDAINNINVRLDSLVQEILANRNAISELDTKIDSEIENVKNLINQNFDALKVYVDHQDNILNEKIDNIQIGLIKVYDPTTGLLSPLQTVINNLAQVSNKDGLTASEFDDLELTAQAFDNYEITAYEFDSSGKTILV